MKTAVGTPDPDPEGDDQGGDDQALIKKCERCGTNVLAGSDWHDCVEAEQEAWERDLPDQCFDDDDQDDGSDEIADTRVMKQCVILPTDREEPGDWRDSGEGGLAFYLLVRAEKIIMHCSVGGARWPMQDVQCNLQREYGQYAPGDLIAFSSFPTDDWDRGTDVAAAVLIGSTSLALYSESAGTYFVPTVRDLTPEGEIIAGMLELIYGVRPDIVTLLDT